MKNCTKRRKIVRGRKKTPKTSKKTYKKIQRKRSGGGKNTNKSPHESTASTIVDYLEPPIMPPAAPPIQTPAPVNLPQPPRYRTPRPSSVVTLKQQKNQKIQKILLGKIPTIEALNIPKEKLNYVLGRGAFGIVYLINSKTTTKQFAIKQLNITKQLNKYMLKYTSKSIDELIHKILDNIINEKNILDRVKSVCDTYYLCYEGFYYEIDSDNNTFYIYILMEYLQDGMDLLDFMREHPLISVEIKYSIINDICQGVKKLHEMGIAHRDLKPENIYVYEKNGKYQIKLLDFGLSCILDPTQSYNYCGTPIYSDPEIIDSRCLNELQVRISDLWSVAMIVIFIFDLEFYNLIKYYIEEAFKQPDKSQIKPYMYDILTKIFTDSLTKDDFHESEEDLHEYKLFRDLERYNEFIQKTPEPMLTIDIRNFLLNAVDARRDENKIFGKYNEIEAEEYDMLRPAEKVGGVGGEKDLCIKPLGYEADGDDNIYDSLNKILKNPELLYKTIRPIYTEKSKKNWLSLFTGEKNSNDNTKKKGFLSSFFNKTPKNKQTENTEERFTQI